MKHTIDTEIEIEVFVEYDYRASTRDSFSHEHGNWLPGDPPEASCIQVYALVSVKALKDALKTAEEMQLADEKLVKIDIFAGLDDDVRVEIEDDCIEDAKIASM